MKMFGRGGSFEKSVRSRGGRKITMLMWLLPISIYTECKYGGSLGRPGSSCAKARLVRPREFCFDCAS